MWLEESGPFGGINSIKMVFYHTWNMNVGLNSFRDKWMLANHSEGIAQTILVANLTMLTAEGELALDKCLILQSVARRLLQDLRARTPA